MIKVTDKYYIKQEKDCCIIYESVWSKKDNKNVFLTLCYPRDLVSAIEKIMRYSFAKITDEREMSLKEALEILIDLKDKYQKILIEIKEMQEVE